MRNLTWWASENEVCWDIFSQVQVPNFAGTRNFQVVLQLLDDIVVSYDVLEKLDKVGRR